MQKKRLNQRLYLAFSTSWQDASSYNTWPGNGCISQNNKNEAYKYANTEENKGSSQFKTLFYITMKSGL